MLSSYRISSNTLKRRQKISNATVDEDSNREGDLKRPHMTSNDFKRPQKIELVKHTTNKKSKMKGGFVQDIDEMNDEHLDAILHENNLYMELAKQIFSKDQTVRTNTVHYFKGFDAQTLATQAKKDNN